VTPAEIVAAAQLACLLEASAAKPGNVSPGRRFDDLCYEDFLAAAAAIGEPLSGAATRPLGRTVRLAVEATARWTRSNVNLGIVLLLAPLTRAAMRVVLGSDPGTGRLNPLSRPVPGSDPIQTAARIAQLDQDLADFPRGFDTMVGERGITLSGGQKQRTALARALAIDPRILILDDALSAVDTYTEEEILRGLSRVMRQRTSLIVSHRISTVRGADQILVLDAGRIVERGTHDELVRHGGLYAQLYRKQLLEEELAAS
jgi:hypothetical protein